MTDALTTARIHFLAGVRAFESEDLAAAEAAFVASLQALPGRPSTLMNLAATRTRAGRPAEALPLLDQALAAEPHSTEALCHRGAALAALGRHAPALLPSGRRFAAALDLGCGTGLMAPLLRPVCGVIDGVDLSSQMLEKARASGLYRHLWHADVVEQLRAATERYDLVLAADVFVYVGALDAVFAAVAQVLAPGGVFLFSVEEADVGQSVQLRPSARYAHSCRYVEDLAALNGLEVQHVDRQTLRHDQGQPIAGLLMRLVLSPR